MKPVLETVEFTNVSFGYGNQELFKQFDLKLPVHQVVLVRSQMGQGKSALLKLLAGLVPPKTGNFTINGQAINEMSFEEFLPLRLQIGYAFDAGGLLNNRSLRENLALPLEYHKLLPPDEIRQRVDEMLKRFELVEVANKRPSAVSGSQRKATCIARALILDPQLLILDDPSTGLAAPAEFAMIKWIEGKLNDGSLKFVVIATSEDFIINNQRSLILEIRDHQVAWTRDVVAA